ncbi:carboxylesterase/lipase family protein [Actinoplanes siamensis]|uniref:Para-nitrobenzyl esterase n=1 Tax=Actinoplanes siamensis TaxID=1223317 RepID=A0A919TLU0_9ACTN|nr:carboxylesterase family protein [Actinoplanes siamensis]GIF07596.1 para-nitrobenzyl esterase [Actinoplanes siamensis]
MMIRRVLTGFVGLTLAAVSIAPAAAASRDSAVLRHTDLGTIKGNDQSRSTGTYTWLGIPYAEPPVGPLRWHAPLTHQPWSGVRHTTAYGNGCIQQGRLFSPAPSGPHYGLDIRDGLGQPVGAEDCLTLNVYRPATRQKKLPVIVFVHGGSNVVGYSADPMYDGNALARTANAVVVTINYRLGSFGWLDLPQLKTGDPANDSGNFATLDQIEALRFVHRNIAAFGGDAANVTAMGESAGAVNVWALLVSPLAKGLIDKVIPLSGGLLFATPAQARTYADALVTAAVGSSGNRDEDVRRLRQLPAADVIRAQIARGAVVGDPPAVIADGTVLPTDYHAAITTGAFAGIPVLAGNTLEEGKLFGAVLGAYRPSDYERFTRQYFFNPNKPSPYAVRDFINDRYLPVDAPDGWNAASKQLGDAIFAGIVRDSMNAMQAAGNKNLYYYQFGWNQQPAPFDAVYGASHAIDLPFVFGTFDRGVFAFAFSRRNAPGRLQLSGLMMDSIAAFVRTGRPHQNVLGTRWEQWPRSLVLDAGDRAATAAPGSVG